MTSERERERDAERDERFRFQINDTDGVQLIIRELQDFSRSSKPNVRQVTIDLLLSFCKQAKGSYQDNIDDLLRISITLFSDENEQIVTTAWDCVDTIVKVR